MLRERCHRWDRVISRCGRPGALARGLTRPEWLSEGEPWDAAVEEVSAAELVARETTVTLNGWLGPRWTRSGWFHAYRLLGALDHRATAGVTSRRPMSSGCRTVAYAGAVERINLERELLQSLALRLPRPGGRLHREAGIFQCRVLGRHREHQLRCAGRVQLADVPAHGEAQGLSLERLAAARARSATERRLEPHRRLHRPVRPPHVVRRRRPGSDTHALRSGLDAQPLLRCRGLATAMLLARQKIRVRIGTPVRPDRSPFQAKRMCLPVPQSCSSLLSHWR